VEESALYSILGATLWENQKRAREVTSETLAAVSSLRTPGLREDFYDLAVQTLLDRALREKKVLNLFHPFYRLETEERFALFALHNAQWSYARIAKILRVTPLVLQELAWRARLQLSGQIPLGPRRLRANCPDYDARRPWTQRFLDEEIHSGQERLFFQNHLMACDSCRDSLSGCRDLYYSIEKKFPSLAPNRAETDLLEKFLETPTDIDPSSWSLGWIAFKKFMSKRDVQTLFLFLALLVAIRLHP